MRLGLVTDIHELAGSLGLVLKEAELRGCDEIACLGDIMGWEPDLYPSGFKSNPNETIQMVRTTCKWCVSGNHDSEALLTRTDLTDENRSFLASLPGYQIIKPVRDHVLLSHYLYPDFTGSSMVFIRRLSQLDELTNFFQSNSVQLAFAGHDHPSGAGFGYPSVPKWFNRFRKAFHYFPYGRYDLDGESVVCLVPAVATRSGRAGFAIWDTTDHWFEAIQIHSIP